MLLPWPVRCSALTFAAISFLSMASTRAQEPMPPKPAVPPSVAIVIPEEPRGIDPATLLPAKLAAPVRIDFKETPLGDVVRWLQTDQKVGVILEQAALAKEDILTSEPITDKLENLPLHLLFDRLRSYGIGWYVEDALVHLTTLDDAESKMRTTPYNVGDLVDKGFKTDAILQAITSTVAPKSWDSAGGKANIVELGDVLFVSQSPANHLQVAGLLKALRTHGRRTYTYDPPGHDKVRAALDKPVSIDVHEVALSAALEQLSKTAGIDIRIDKQSLQSARNRERQPVSLTVENHKLRVILKVLLDKLSLRFTIRDGALWVTSEDLASEYYKTAVYDVRDLCRDEQEAAALKDAVENQMGGIWEHHGGIGAMEFPVPCAMVVYLTEQNHNRLLDLLESYRAALRVSKPRARTGSDPKEVITRYYRMPTTMARDLVSLLPQLLKEESWKSEKHREAAGTILQLNSKAEVRAAAAPEAKKGTEPAGNSVLIPYSVLVIKQTREVHDQLPELLQKIENGEAFDNGLGGNGMGGMGGFGGGFFNVPAK